MDSRPTLPRSRAGRRVASRGAEPGSFDGMARERSGSASGESKSDRFRRIDPHTGDGRGAAERPLSLHARPHAFTLMNASVSNGTRTFLMYAQDGKGMGHITRTTTIAKHLLAANPNWVAYITTEPPVIGEFALPDRCDYLKLPRRMSPTTVVEAEAEHEAAIDHFRIHVRSRILREAALALAPDFVLVDHEPLGRKGEF